MYIFVNQFRLILTTHSNSSLLCEHSKHTGVESKLFLWVSKAARGPGSINFKTRVPNNDLPFGSGSFL